VLTVTTSEQRIETMLDALREVTNGKGSDLFLFTTERDLAAGNPMEVVWSPRKCSARVAPPTSRSRGASAPAWGIDRRFRSARCALGECKEWNSQGERKGHRVCTSMPLRPFRKEMSSAVTLRTQGTLFDPVQNLLVTPRHPTSTESDPRRKLPGLFEASDVSEAVRDTKSFQVLL
jgi:hypothetical protein